LKLYYSPNLNPRVAVAVARHLASQLDFVRCSPRHPDHEKAFRAINPNALVPILEEDDGRRLWETDAIACRLSALAGSNFWRVGEALPEMLQWVSWSAHHFNAAASVLYFDRLIRPGFSDQGANPAILAEAERDWRAHAAVLDAALADRDWLLGGRLSYADFRAATALPFADGAGLPVVDFPNIKRWHDRLWEMDAWRDPFAGLAIAEA
jgi:glutathione S-transferase